MWPNNSNSNFGSQGDLWGNNSSMNYWDISNNSNNAGYGSNTPFTQPSDSNLTTNLAINNSGSNDNWLNGIFGQDDFLGMGPQGWNSLAGFGKLGFGIYGGLRQLGQADRQMDLAEKYAKANFTNQRILTDERRAKQRATLDSAASRTPDQSYLTNPAKLVNV